jgi:hypothetical protein
VTKWKDSEIPDTLRPYLHHKVNLYKIQGKEALGDCPFCTKPGKFTVNVEKGTWRCLSCNEGVEREGSMRQVYKGGNVYTFLKRLWEISEEQTTDYSELRVNRKLLSDDVLIEWQVTRSIITDEWLVPAFNAEGKLIQLYRYVLDASKHKFTLLATAGLPHGLFGVNLYDSRKEEVYLCEGPWDAICLYELDKSVNVLAVPGVGVFNEKWCPLFSGKKVSICYDNDYPKKNAKTGVLSQPASWTGAIRTSGILVTAEGEGANIHVLRWDEKENYSSAYKEGYDVRDLLSTESTKSKRINRLEQLRDMVRPVPSDWITEQTISAKSNNSKLDLLHCCKWVDLRTAWRKALQWTPGLDRGLAVLLSVVLSTDVLGDPLWVKLMSPPSTGKSTLGEAIAVARKYVYPSDTMTSLLSGYQTDKEGKENHSLICKLKNKTLVIKDADTVLSDPNVTKILAQFRGFYDRNLRSHYGNKMSADHENVNCTVVFCGTASMRTMDSSELGERTLTCCIMESIDDELEDEITWRKVCAADRATAFKLNGKVQDNTSKEETLAKQLTGGYVTWLRETKHPLLSTTSPEKYLREVQRLGKFISYMRARPSVKQEEEADRELSARLSSQLTLLMKCLAVVLNKKEIDEEVMTHVRGVTQDTSKGRTLNICRQLHISGREGLSSGQLALHTGEGEIKLAGLLKFLRQIEAIESFAWGRTNTYKGVIRYRLTDKLYRLYTSVMEGEIE